MQTIRNIRIKNEDDYLVTINLKRLIAFELKLLIREREEKEYIELLTYLINYFTDYNPVINDGQTIAYHSWLLKFVINDNTIILYEAQPNGENFNEGVDYAIAVVTEQQAECNKYGVAPLFPLFNQMVVLSKGVLEGENVDAVRYESPKHMTGWWITTNLYDGNIKSLQTMHYYHLAFKRQDIIKYLALPFGFRLLSSEQNKVWFDEKVLL